MSRMGGVPGRRAGQVALACLLLAAARDARAQNPGSTPEYPTRFANTGKPLQALLSEGFRVVSSHLGIDTIGYVLEHDGKWVTCSVRNADAGKADEMLSQCFAMN